MLNEHFIAVKVDRDERPDVDARYQAAVAAISGQGGWPLTVLLTPEGKPFFGGTYFPPEDATGVPASSAFCWRLRRPSASAATRWRSEPTSVMQAIE